MATAQTAPRARRAPASASGARRPVPRTAGAAIRWDRVGRTALLCVLGGVLLLYVGPAHTWVSTWQEARAKRAEVGQLQAENHRLRARRDALRQTSALEREARRLGMVRPGERAYVIARLPGD